MLKKLLGFFSGKDSRIYFDHASATIVSVFALKSYVETVKNIFANPSSIHFEGEAAKDILHESRKKVARVLQTKEHNVYFTSSATEANNIYIKGIAMQAVKENQNCHIMYSKGDHSGIVETVESLKILGDKITFTNIIPNKKGILPIEEICKALSVDTKLICFSYVHSELGTIQEVRKISQAVRDEWKRLGFEEKDLPKIFVDATQAVKYESLEVGNLLVDGMSFGGNKVGAPSGCAVLFVKPGMKLYPLISGGGQEEGVRSGTENIPAIVSFANTIEELAKDKLDKTIKERVYSLRNYCIKELQKNFNEGGLEIFGDTKFKFNKFFEYNAPHILLISLTDMLGEELCLRLDAKGISVSTATACSLLENSGSNFLKSIGEPVKAKETIRLSFDETNTEREVDFFVKTLKDIQMKYVLN